MIDRIAAARWPRAGLSMLATLRAFAQHSIGLFVRDGCLTGAGALSYATLIALVPATAIALAVLSAFPVFAEQREQLLAAMFNSLVPELGAEVEWWFRYFAGTAVRTTAVGILALAVTVVLLLAAIEDQLHRIWRVKSPRPWVQRILAYWAILTLGPLLLGVSFSLPSYVDLVVRHAGLDAAAWARESGLHQLLRLAPFVLGTLAFTLIYALIPNCAVRWREALSGAVVAAALIEVLKASFALYVAYVSTYRAVYGALAAIPILLLWLYVAWSAVLFGAVVAAALPQWRADELAPGTPAAARRLGLGLALLDELAAQTRQGGTLSTAVLAERLGAATSVIDDDLSLLRNAGIVAAAANGGWVLARALDGMTLVDLYVALGLPLAASLRAAEGYPWRTRIASAIERVAAAESTALSLPLGELIGPAATGLQQRR